MFIEDISRFVSNGIQDEYLMRSYADEEPIITTSLDNNTVTYKHVECRYYIGEPCPICLETMTDTDNVIYCKYSCGKSIHKSCWNTYNKKNCVYCRYYLD